MPTENKPVEPFQREDRYIVIKRSDMDTVPVHLRRNFSGRCRALRDQMLVAGAPARSFLVIESDWPEYEPAWAAIKRRMTGQPPVTAAEELDAVLHWRNKHAQAIKERDALQLRLNAADQLIDELTQRQSEPVEWGAPKTIRQLIRQLETLDQDLRPLSMLRVPGNVFEDGKERVRAVHLSVSHERVEGQWLAPFKGDGEKVLAFWCRMEQPAPGAVTSRDDSISWLKRIDGIGQNRAELIYSMGFRRHTESVES